MSVYSYPQPHAPSYKKPTSVEDCLPQARLLAKKQHGRAAMGPVKKGDNLLIVTLPDQDEHVKEALIQAIMEEGAEKVDFINIAELLNVKDIPAVSVEDGWEEVNMFKDKSASGAVNRRDPLTGLNFSEPLLAYLDEHPDYTGLFFYLGARPQMVRLLGKKYGHKFRNNWL